MNKQADFSRYMQVINSYGHSTPALVSPPEAGTLIVLLVTAATRCLQMHSVMVIRLLVNADGYCWSGEDQ